MNAHDRPTAPRLDEAEQLRAVLRLAVGLLRDLQRATARAADVIEEIEEVLGGP